MEAVNVAVSAVGAARVVVEVAAEAMRLAGYEAAGVRLMEGMANAMEDSAVEICSALEVDPRQTSLDFEGGK